jgi:hypothetical protein
MARRSKSRKPSNLEPAVMTVALTFSVPPTTTVDAYADVSQIASLLNRRFYRQGLNWAVAGFKVFNVNGISGAITVSKLPNTWVMANSWKKGFAAWAKMNNAALLEAESVRPRFLDFKVYADSVHHQLGYGSNLLPLTSAGFATAGEWSAASIFTPNSADVAPAAGADTMNEFEIIATGANFPGGGASGHNAVSLIEGYASSRSLPDVLDPNSPADVTDTSGGTPHNWISAMFNEGTTQDSEVLEDLITENNIAPYPFENDGVNLDTMYPGGANQLVGMQLHDTEYFTLTTISNTVRLKGGNFPCGLIKFSATNNTGDGAPAVVTILLDLIPGRHRGYLAESMTDM